PDQRCSGDTQGGAIQLPSLPTIASPESSWTSASRNAPVASHVLTACGPEKPATLSANPVGSCSRPYAPSAIATTTPTPMIPSTTVTAESGPRRAGAPGGL